MNAFTLICVYKTKKKVLLQDLYSVTFDILKEL